VAISLIWSSQRPNQSFLGDADLVASILNRRA